MSRWAITASGDPAAATRLEISAGLSAFESTEDFCEWDADEIDEIAESIEEVRGIARGTGRPATVGTVGRGGGELGGDPEGCADTTGSGAFSIGSRDGTCVVFGLSLFSDPVPASGRSVGVVAIDATEELCLSLVGGTGKPELGGVIGDPRSDAKGFLPRIGDRVLFPGDS